MYVYLCHTLSRSPSLSEETTAPRLPAPSYAPTSTRWVSSAETARPIASEAQQRRITTACDFLI